MKSMKKSSLLKEEEKKMFAEMNILKDLDHPNIVKLYELFQDEENYYLITECLFYINLLALFMNHFIVFINELTISFLKKQVLLRRGAF